MIYPGLEAVAYFPGTFHEYEILVDGPGESIILELQLLRQEIKTARTPKEPCFLVHHNVDELKSGYD